MISSVTIRIASSSSSFAAIFHDSSLFEKVERRRRNAAPVENPEMTKSSGRAGVFQKLMAGAAEMSRPV